MNYIKKMNSSMAKNDPSIIYIYCFAWFLCIIIICNRASNHKYYTSSCHILCNYYNVVNASVLKYVHIFLYCC